MLSKGHCNFQSGLCGLKPDKNGTFHWTVGSGQTPTESTGPSYDHTSLKMDGKSEPTKTVSYMRVVKVSSNKFSNCKFKPRRKKTAKNPERFSSRPQDLERPFFVSRMAD